MRVLCIAAIFFVFIAGCTKAPFVYNPYTPDAAPKGIGTSDSIRVYFNAPPDACNIDNTVCGVIAAAKSRCWAAIYNINRQNIVDAFVAAKGAGVDVRIVTEDDYRYNPSYQPAYDALAAAGIPIVLDSEGVYASHLMHHKFIVVDSGTVVTGSYNYSDGQTVTDKNDLLVIRSSGVAHLFENEFDQMFTQKKFKRGKVNSSGMVNVAGAMIEVVFSPMGGTENAVSNAAASADASIHFAIFTFTSLAIADVMIARQQAGCPVLGTFDAFQAGGASSKDEYIESSGCSVRRDAYPGLLHDKFMVIDAGTSSDPVVVVGSYNWTTAGDYYNDENCLIIHHGATALMFRENALSIYNNWGN